MPCLIVLLSMISPRLAIIFVALLTNWFSVAFSTVLWPILGFFFMPITTLAYTAAMLNNGFQISGIWVLVMVIAVLLDLVSVSASANKD